MATSNAKDRQEHERQSDIPAQVLYDRSRTSGVELFKHLSTLATAAVGVFFFALSTKVEPPLNAAGGLIPPERARLWENGRYGSGNSLQQFEAITPGRPGTASGSDRSVR